MKTLRFFTFGVVAASVLSLMAQSPQRVEYFLDTDPGYGLGRLINNIRVGDNQLIFDVSDIRDGAHVLYVRCQDDSGVWSTTMSRPLFIDRLQDIVYMEYFFDGNDPGVGKATSIALPEQDYKAHLDFSFSPDILNLDIGEHELSVRARDAFDVWTDVMSRKFTIVETDVPEPPTPVTGDLARLEYFFDTDPGYGKGQALLNPNTGTNVYLMSFDAVEAGAHVLYLRAQDKSGVWSSTMSRPLYVVNPSETGIVAMEYFFDETDPGEGKANAVVVTDPKANELSFDINTNTLAEGNHTLSVRVKSTDGRWSLLSTEPFSITNGQNGISTITFTMPLRMSLSDHILTVEATEGTQKGNRQIELFDIDGRCLASALWPASEQAITLHVDAINTVIVKVTDVQNKKQTVKHIVVR